MTRPNRYLADLVEVELLAHVDEQRRENDRNRARASRMPPPGSVDAAALRKARLLNQDGTFRPRQVAEASDECLQTTAGQIAIRCFPTQNSHGVIVHFHGGGWALGSVYEQDEQLSELAAHSGALVVSVDYPLAPEHGLPHATDVARRTLEALVVRYKHCSVAILGESAGAHIALQSIIGLPANLRRRFAALALTYGIFDLSMTPSQRSWGSDFLGLSTEWLNWFYDLTLPGVTHEARRDPTHSPLYADLRDLPPALFTIGLLDPLLDDSLFMSQRWLAAGNCSQLAAYPEAPHGFNHQETAMARACNVRVATFLQEALAGAFS